MRILQMRPTCLIKIDGKNSSISIVAKVKSQINIRPQKQVVEVRVCISMGVYIKYC